MKVIYDNYIHIAIGFWVHFEANFGYNSNT